METQALIIAHKWISTEASNDFLITPIETCSRVANQPRDTCRASEPRRNDSEFMREGGRGGACSFQVSRLTCIWSGCSSVNAQGMHTCVLATEPKP